MFVFVRMFKGKRVCMCAFVCVSMCMYVCVGATLLMLLAFMCVHELQLVCFLMNCLPPEDQAHAGWYCSNASYPLICPNASYCPPQVSTPTPCPASLTSYRGTSAPSGCTFGACACVLIFANVERLESCGFWFCFVHISIHSSCFLLHQTSRTFSV
jgi:hypothetical protein